MEEQPKRGRPKKKPEATLKEEAKVSQDHLTVQETKKKRELQYAMIGILLLGVLLFATSTSTNYHAFTANRAISEDLRKLTETAIQSKSQFSNELERVQIGIYSISSGTKDELNNLIQVELHSSLAANGEGVSTRYLRKVIDRISSIQSNIELTEEEEEKVKSINTTFDNEIKKLKTFTQEKNGTVEILHEQKTRIKGVEQKASLVLEAFYNRNVAVLNSESIFSFPVRSVRESSTKQATRDNYQKILDLTQTMIERLETEMKNFVPTSIINTKTFLISGENPFLNLIFNFWTNTTYFALSVSADFSGQLAFAFLILSGASDGQRLRVFIRQSMNILGNFLPRVLLLNLELIFTHIGVQ